MCKSDRIKNSGDLSLLQNVLFAKPRECNSSKSNLNALGKYVIASKDKCKTVEKVSENILNE